MTTKFGPQQTFTDMGQFDRNWGPTGSTGSLQAPPDSIARKSSRKSASAVFIDADKLDADFPYTSDSSSTIQKGFSRDIINLKRASSSAAEHSVGLSSQRTSASLNCGTGSQVPSRKSVICDSTSMLEMHRRDIESRRIPARKKLISCSRKVVEHNTVVSFTTLLTIYALIGDDLRLICTNKPLDPVFNYIVILCLVVFTLECGLSCIGKDDYYLSFFFWLDFVSSASLVLDLSWVSEELQGGGEEEGDMSNLRGGRTARLGAKASRVIRVVRLIRILKLYKAYYEAKQRQKEREKRKEKGMDSDEDDWEDFEPDTLEAGAGNRETRVGKKLGEITIRRVIILVLTMLLVLPFLIPASQDQYGNSAIYGADHVHQTFRMYVEHGTDISRRAYENAYLKFFFYHNWYATAGYCPDSQTCANQYYAHAFWIGVAGKNSTELQRLATLAKVSSSAVDRWLVEQTEFLDYIYNYGAMPAEGLKMLASRWSISNCDTKTFQRLGMSLLQEETSVISYAAPCPQDLRIPERKKVNPRLMTKEQYDDWHLDFYFDLRAFSRQDAALNLGIVSFICFVLCVAAMSFASDANHLVLTPVENMIKRVEEIRENPLIAMKMADEEFKAEEMKKAKSKRQAKARFKELINCKGLRSASEPMETVILEKTIIKLGSLLALGFGEAGANIIAANMKSVDGGVNAMIPGHRVNCIMGNARIRNFSSATEVLKSKIMTFVNQIAEIVHGVVDEYYGAANKNIGDQFLIVWRLEDLNDEEVQRLAEMAVVAFALILGGLHRSPVLAEYRTHPGLQQRLGTNFRVNLSFGLHCGWAIEGAVGSEFKIDASYLSPNVSIVKSIEQATMLYGVHFIIPESVFDLLSDEMAPKIRLIDKVIITGSSKPMSIYSVDLDARSISVDTSLPLPFPWTSQRRFRARQLLEAQKLTKWNRNITIGSSFVMDRTIRTMRRRYSTAFFQHFNMGYQNYCQGEWAVARRMLVGTKTMLGGDEDGPSAAILRFMEGFAFTPPKDWQGVHVLVQNPENVNIESNVNNGNKNLNSNVHKTKTSDSLASKSNASTNASTYQDIDTPLVRKVTCIDEPTFVEKNKDAPITLTCIDAYFVEEDHDLPYMLPLDSMVALAGEASALEQEAYESELKL